VITIRTAVPDDADGLASLRRATYPYLVRSAAAIRYRLVNRDPAERAETYVAEDSEKGTIIGAAWAELSVWTSEQGAAGLNLHVHPDHRHRGAGTALVEAAHAHLGDIGARTVHSFCTEDSAGFAQNLGYEMRRQVHYSGVDPRVLPPQPGTPGDVTLLPLSEVEPRLAYDADATASLDEPGDLQADAMTYEDWFRDVWVSPAQNLPLGVAAMVDGKVACFTAVETDGDRAWSGFTGTVPEHRGRGLAKLVKSVALRRAAEAGVTAAYTSNDDGNPAMLAINDWLGYRRVATHLTCLRHLA
jgi:GNAT superfamily N-acetyltransferase